MRVAIFIRSCAKHVQWLDYCMRSIRKFASGFQYVVVTAPLRDHEAMAAQAKKWGGFRLHESEEPVGKGMLCGEMKVCHADEICPDTDYILFTDSDCIFTGPVCPELYFVDGKPVLMGESFAKLAGQRDGSGHTRYTYWRKAVYDCLGFYPEYETMYRHPAVHHRSLFAPFREAVQKHTGMPFDQYVLSCRNEFPQTFAEFPALGAFALKHCPEKYRFVDIDGPAVNTLSMAGTKVIENRLVQHWTHQAVGTELAAELERLLSWYPGI